MCPARRALRAKGDAMRVGSYKRISAGQSKSGFTLVELLVVIAVIGILSAIMFPVLNKAKENARALDCVSNLRQLGSALQMYYSQYDDRFPAAIPWGIPGGMDQNGNRGDKTIQELLSPLVKGGMVREESSGLYTKGGVFACPSDIGIPREDDRGRRFDMLNGVPAGKTVWRYTGCSYEYYASNQEDWLHWESDPPKIPWTALSPEVLARGQKIRVGAPISSVVHITKKAVLGDIWFWHMGDQVPVGLLANRNTLFADGHAARVRGRYHLEARLEPLKHWHEYRELQ